jgi:hypothetical protein
MTIEAFKKSIESTISRLKKPKTYKGMSGDIELISQTIIPQNLGQHVETVSSEGIGEGTPEEALVRLLRVRDVEQIAEEINRRHGHGETSGEVVLDIETLQTRIEDLQSS